MRTVSKTALVTPPETLTLDVDGELITLDESFMDFTDLTPDELAVIDVVSSKWRMTDDGEPTAGLVALSIYMKMSRGRDWHKPHVDAIVPLLVAWLTDNLEVVG
jgi:hypothetical protein